MAAAVAPLEGARLVAALRERLLRGLHELAACRRVLDLHDVSFDTSFSSQPEDHADVLEGPLPGTEGGWNQMMDAEALGAAAVARRAVVGPTAPSTPSSASSSPALPPDAAALDAAARAVLEGPVEGMVGPEALAASSVGQAQAPAGLAPEVSTLGSEADAARLRENLEEELSMAKALLMLNNVTLHMDFDQGEAGAGAASAAQVVKLKGSRHLIQLLITLKQKVSLLNQQYLLLRGDMLYLSHEMNVCRHWILQSFRGAMQHLSNEHSSLQTRFERLSKVLN
mmetsp:Transcript_67731/g.201465  ORF Transcript_67731/g.201465 Transcript_67731/m.201465 type:complete len:283 (-) Transcript_67731:94-942(-)